ncbi:MAG: hypothetical protein ACRCV0_05025, partial [Brevinema sp.]
MKLDDHGIKFIITEYHNSKDKLYIQQFQEKIYHFVLKWVKLTYHCNEDICNDFLLFILESSEQIMLSCPTDLKVLFKTWFVAVLVNKFADFSKSGEVSSYYETMSFEFVEDVLTNVQETFLVRYHQLISIAHNLTDHEQSILFFFYMPRDVNENHIYALSEFLKKPIHIVMQAYQN